MTMNGYKDSDDFSPGTEDEEDILAPGDLNGKLKSPEEIDIDTPAETAE